MNGYGTRGILHGVEELAYYIVGRSATVQEEKLFVVKAPSYESTRIVDLLVQSDHCCNMTFAKVSKVRLR